jgi:predicted AAA+ superfamily ATPase
MNLLQREIEQQVVKALKPNKVIIVLGARRVGKTELIKQVLSHFEGQYLFLNGEDMDTQRVLEYRSQKNYELLLGRKRMLVIDEAQDIPDIGAKLKLMVDTIPGLKILVTGSSVFDLTNKMGEPLVGRKTTFFLYPFAQIEFSIAESYLETKSSLEERLVFGSYPELRHLSGRKEKIEYLKEQVNSYLLKDIAFRAGSEVSLESIGNDLQISKNTVERYLDLLTKVFVIHRVSGFSRNLDNEITKKHKWYFWDNGIRNAIIGNFNGWSQRDDIGQLWENYLISERLKLHAYKQHHVSTYFWRTHNKQEIDWVEERNGSLFAYEMKWKQLAPLQADC